jgi:hypothetical protein
MFRFLVRTFLSGLTCVLEARIVIYPLDNPSAEYDPTSQ